jgi:hypothetical protein
MPVSTWSSSSSSRWVSAQGYAHRPLPPEANTPATAERWPRPDSTMPGLLGAGLLLAADMRGKSGSILMVCDQISRFAADS